VKSPPLPSSPNGRKYKLLYEDMRDRALALSKKAETQKEEYEKILSEKDLAIKELTIRLQKEPMPLKMNNDDIFIIKPKKGPKNQKASTETCTVSGCENTNADLIKCNLCGNHICEECSSVKFTKLRPVMNQCDTLYFTCHSCDALMRNKDVDIYDTMNSKISLLKEELESCERLNGKLTTEVEATQRLQERFDKLSAENKAQAGKIEELQVMVASKEKDHSGCKGQMHNLNQKIKTLNDHHESLRCLLEERENSLHEAEAKLISLEQTADPPSNNEVGIEQLINNQFDKITKHIDDIIEKKLGAKAQSNQAPTSSETKTLFSAVVGAQPPVVTTNAAASLITSRNAEMIEKKEQEKRVNNIIIYGISEQRVDDNVSVQEQDTEFMSTFLEEIEVNVTPKQILRLGQESAGRNRPLKVIMKCPEDKSAVMSSLNKLKNADAPLRGVSVRDDYTIEERQLIKTLTEEAKRKNEEENVTHWKVRGTPKNGLRVVKIPTRR
jgi:uncharacterized coiled-coil protein SlyX